MEMGGVRGIGYQYELYFMNQCLRCSKPCAATSVFCDGCRALLRDQLQRGERTASEGGTFSSASIGTSPLVATISEQGDAQVNGDPLERITSPHTIVKDPETPQPSTTAIPTDYADMIDQALNRLNEAARRIAEVRQNQENGEASQQNSHRIPRASRLAPIRDISADIQRESTPLPLDTPTATEGEEAEQSHNLSRRMPDLWPWLQDADADDVESENWTNRTDPLISRHFPDSAEAARIEEEDIRRAIAEGQLTSPLPVRRSRSTYARIAFIVLSILAAMALIADGLLVSLTFIHPQQGVNPTGGSPTLTLSPGVATIGQTVWVHIRHFSPSTHVLLTHDVQEPIQVSTGSPLIKVEATGDTDVSFLVDSSWEPGFHMIESEDVTTRYTASATLQIIGSGPTRPSHLIINTTSLNMGADVQGTNTIQSVVLGNSGGGSISWAGSSNSPWLLLTPTQGMFGESQSISVAVERGTLKPGDYTGKITISSNVGTPQEIQIQMTVRPLPANAGPVLMVTPAALSFTAIDGGSDPTAQFLGVSNPGSQPLNWSLSDINLTALASQSSLLRTLDASTSWLSADRISGIVAPHSTMMIHIYAHSQTLLPGVYTATLVFNANPGVLDSPQNVSISLTVEPHCGLTLSAGSMSFTAVAGQNSPNNRTLGLTATSSCTGSISWHAVSSASWLTETPVSGQLKGATSSVTTVAVNSSGLLAGTYGGTISILTGQSTQTVMVQLIVQVPSSIIAPLMGASPLTLNFNTTQGSSNPPSQAVTITNNGGSTLHWHTTVNTLAPSWLGVSPTGGVIAPGQTGQLTVNINIAGLTPGTYPGQIVLAGTDDRGGTAGGSPQTVTVSLLVLPPCTLAQPSASALAFTATAGSADPNPQLVAITGTGNCTWPSSWKATITTSTPWLKLTPSSGQLLASGQSANISVAASIAGLVPGTYTAQVSITATNGSSMQAQGSPQKFSVTLSVLQPCALQTPTSGLSFTVSQGQSTSAGQNVVLKETGTCVRPVSWTAAGDSGSSSWLVLSPTSGTDNGNGGTIGVSVNASALQPGVYTGYITVSATSSGGAIVQGSPQTIPVTLTVTGFTISGTVIACSDTSCTTSTTLPNASLILQNSSGTQVASTVADASGSYSFSNLATGTYTLIASGTDSGGTHYTTTITLVVTGNQANFNVKAYPG